MLRGRSFVAFLCLSVLVLVVALSSCSTWYDAFWRGGASTNVSTSTQGVATRNDTYGSGPTAKKTQRAQLTPPQASKAKALASVTSSATPAVTLSTAQLDAKIDALVATTSTHVAVEIGLADGTTLYQHESATLFDAASLYKLGIMVEVYQERDVGALTFDDPVTLYPGFFYEDDSVYAVDSSEYTDVSVGELLSLPPSATTSSNSSAGGTYDITSPHEMVQLLEQLLSGTVLSPATSAEMLALLSQQEINDRLPAGVPPGTRVAHKTGDLDSLLHDAGEIYAPRGPIVVVVIMTDDVENRDDVMGIRFRRLTGRIWMASFPVANDSRTSVHVHVSGGPHGTPGWTLGRCLVVGSLFDFRWRQPVRLSMRRMLEEGVMSRADST